MATFTKRGEMWRAQVRRKGFRAESRTFPSKGQARVWAAQRESEILAGIRAPNRKATLAQALDRFAREVSPRRAGARWEAVRLAALCRYEIACVPLVDLSAGHLARWRDDRAGKVGPATVRREMALLGAVLEQCRREWGWIRTNPLRDVRKPPQPAHRERLYSAQEITDLCAALGWRERRPETLGQQIAAAFIIALETAMRQGELLGLRWDRVDLVQRVATLEKTKNGDARQVPLSTRAVEVLGMLRGIDRDQPFTVKAATFDAMFRDARRRAGVDGATFHDSRATAITRLAKRLDVLELARMVGHRDPKSLMAYYRETAADLAKKLG